MARTPDFRIISYRFSRISKPHADRLGRACGEFRRGVFQIKTLSISALSDSIAESCWICMGMPLRGARGNPGVSPGNLMVAADPLDPQGKGTLFRISVQEPLAVP